MDQADELVKLQALVKAQDRTAQQLRTELQQVRNQVLLQQSAAESAQRAAMTAEIANGNTLEQVSLQIASLETALAGARHRVQSLEQSLSWRLTAPLRAFGKTFAGNGKAR